MAIISDSSGNSLVKTAGEVEKEEAKQRKKEEIERDPTMLYRPRKVERARIKIPEQEVEKLKKLYSSVAVHDYGDVYHMTDEEREEENHLYKMFQIIQQVKTKYKRLDQYVINYRKILKVIRKVAEENGIMDPDDFFQKVLEGKITVNGIRFPKYSVPKKKKREINWDLVSEYILNDSLDPKDLIRDTNPKVDWDDEVPNTKHEMQEMFGSNYEKYLEGTERKQGHVDLDEPERLIEENVLIPLSKMDFVQIGKGNKEFGNQLRDIMLKFRKFSQMEKELREDPDCYGSIFYGMNEDINEIRDMDEERGLILNKKNDMPVFTGSITKDSDVKRYEFQVNEYLRNHQKVNVYGNETMTVAQYEEEKLREYLEQCGWNVRKLYGIEDKEKRLQKKVDKQHKKYRKIKESLIQSKKRQTDRVKMKGFDVEMSTDDDKVNKKKKKSKSKKKIEKQVKQIAKFSGAAKDFEEYEKQMLNFSSDELD